MVKRIQVFSVFAFLFMTSISIIDVSAFNTNEGKPSLFFKVLSAFRQNITTNQRVDTAILVTPNVVAASVVSVASQTGVVNPNNAIGNPDGAAALLYDPSDEIILDLGITLNAGQQYSIVWHKKTAYGAGDPADMLVAESVNSSTGFVNHPTNPSSTDLNTFTTTTLTANVNVRYLKIKTLTATGDDLDLDAVTYTTGLQNEICDNNIDDDGDGFIDGTDPDCPCAFFTVSSIDFSRAPNGNAILAGTTPFETYASWGLHITTDTPASRPPMVFNSASPSGGDTDLGTPNQNFGGPGIGGGGEAGEPGENNTAQGNLLIISTDGDSLDPDDHLAGGTLTFNFDQNVNIASFVIIDLDVERTDSWARCYDASNNLLSETRIIAYGNNSYQKVVVGTGGVRRLDISIPTSFSVGELFFCDDDIPTASIGDFVWNDANNDGLSVSEPGIPNVKVYLRNSANEILTETYTNSKGYYSFDNLASPANYLVTIETPAGYNNTYDLDSDADANSGVFTLGAGEQKNDVDFGIIDPNVPLGPSCDGYAYAGSGSVGNAFLGYSDGSYATLNGNSNYLVATLSGIIPAGTEYTIHMSGNNSQASSVDVWEAPTGTSLPTSQQNSPSGFTSNGTASASGNTIIAVTKIAVENIKYIYLDRSSRNPRVDAITFTLDCGVEICGDGIDNNNDGFIDCADSACGPIVSTNNNGPICIGSIIQLTGNIETTYSGTTTYSWTGPNGFTSSDLNPVINNANTSIAGNYILTASNDNGCSASSSTSVVIQADCSNICDQIVQVSPTNPTECILTNGSIFVTEYTRNPSFYQNSIDGVTWFESEHTYTGLGVGTYIVYLRDKATGISCRAITIDLTVDDFSLYTGENVTGASSCFNNNGSIQLFGVSGTDRVSWISAVDRDYVLISSLSPTNTITGLSPGTYYVRVVSGDNDYCFNERLVIVPNNGVPCEDDLCGGATTDNSFPDGDFGSGTAKDRGPLPTGVTDYGYVASSCTSPNDGLYNVTNNTVCNNSGSTPFESVWVATEDHTIGDTNGYFMVVNASFNPDIAIERSIDNLCENTQYEFSLWIRDLAPSAPIRPNLTFLVDGVGLYSSGNITSTNWQKVGFSFYTGNKTSMSFSIRNNAPGGDGNDWAIDDIFVGICLPTVVGTDIQRCFNEQNVPVEFTITDEKEQYTHYQIQKSTNNGVSWTNVGTPQIGTFSAGSYTAQAIISGPMASGDNGNQYRVAIGTTVANLTNGCEISTYAPLTLTIVTCSEICYDGIDNDFNGFTDCDDSAADCAPELSSIVVSACQEDDLGDVAILSFNVDWSSAPAGAGILVKLGEINRELVNVSGSINSSQSLTFTIPADGSTNNPVSVQWTNVAENCETSYTYDAPASCSDPSDRLGCTILYLCGDDKPEDGDAWDHGAIEYINANNAGGTLTPAFTKNDATGLGLYDPMNNALPLSIDIDDYSLIIVSPTTEGRISSDLIAALKITPAAVLLQNYLVVYDLGMSTSGATYSFQTNLYIDNSNSVEIYNYNNPTGHYTQVMTGANYAANADAYAWFNAGDQAAGINGVYFSYDETDVLPGVPSTHGKRVFLGYHMNGLYYNSENGGAMPAPISEWLVPETDFTTEGKNFWDDALLDSAEECACAFDIESVNVTSCVANAGTVGAMVEVEISWRPNVTDNINVTANGSTQLVNVNTASSPVILSFNIPVDDSVGNIITAVQNSTACEETATYDTPSTCGVNAGDCPGPTVTAGANITVCEGETVNLSATATQGDYNFTYSWNNGLGGGQTHSFVGTASTTANNVTDYTVTATDGNGCTATDIVRVTVLSNPDVSATYSDEYCGQNNGTITFTFTDNSNRTGIAFSINNGANYSYSTNDNTGTYTVTGLSAGTYQLYSRWGDNSCPISIGSVTLLDVSAPTVTASVNDNDICEGETVTLSAVGNGGTGSLSYAWNNGGGSGASVSVSPITTTTYTVTVTDSEGCTDTDQVIVNVTNNFDDGGTIGTDESNCGSFNPANITNISSPAAGTNGTVQYVWQSRVGAGSWATISGETGLSYNPPTISITTQYRRIARRLPCTQWQISNTVTKTVETSPIVNAGTDIEVCVGETVNLSATASGGDGNYSYTWDNGLGTGNTKTFTAIAPSTANSIIDYTVTVTDGSGCSDTDVVRVTVKSQPSIFANKSDEHCNQGDGYISVSFADNTDRTQIEFSIDGGASYPYNVQNIDGTFVIGSLSAGTYDLWARWGDGDCPISIQSLILINTAGISVVASPDEDICVGEGTVITANASGGTFPYLYTWDNGLGNGQSKIVYPTVSTTYSVTATDNFGCAAVDATTVTVLLPTNAACSPCVDPADVDNDGVCASEDCDDNNPNLPAAVGTTCDDSNIFTINDEIQSDSCSCVGEYIPCNTTLNIATQQPDYNDNGTPANLSDDTFTFEATISGNGNGWIANSQTGTYGQTVTFGPYTVDTAGIIFDVVDQDNPNCQESISVNISSCIYSGVCTCCN